MDQYQGIWGGVVELGRAAAIIRRSRAWMALIGGVSTPGHVIYDTIGVCAY